MYGFIIAIVVIGNAFSTDGETRMVISKGAWLDHVSCESRLADVMQQNKVAADLEFGPNGYLIAGKCMLGVGQPS